MFRFRTLLISLGALGCAALVLSVLLYIVQNASVAGRIVADDNTSPNATEVAAVEASNASTSEHTEVGTSTPPQRKNLSFQTSIKAPPTTKTELPLSPLETPLSAPNSAAVQIIRAQAPYSTPPLSFSSINTSARAALVNILCEPHGGSLRPISGSGVLIDSRGIILTNAHVAQYVLLSESANVELSCSIRTGSPAVAKWRAKVLYIPPVWVDEHVQEIESSRAMGTGAHDYALLWITGPLEGSMLATTFPYLSPDVREAIGFLGDSVLAGSYPAEFLGGSGVQYNLYSVSSISTIEKLLTFETSTVDAISLGGVIGAQSGSSGGLVANAWGRLIGIITTTSDGETTAQRDLRAITLSYINRDIKVQSGHDLESILSNDPAVVLLEFDTQIAPSLISKYIDVLSK